MKKRASVLLLALWTMSCGTTTSQDDAGTPRDVPDNLPDSAPVDVAPETWVFHRGDYDIVNGWILLDSDPTAVENAITTAAQYGVNHIQLSHGLIMNIEDILDDTPAAQARLTALNKGIETAHQYGMEAYIWCHELSGTGLDVCYDTEDDLWDDRAQAYREGLALLPGLDGVVLMFGSAPSPPWFTVCGCAWCLDNFPLDNPFEVPPQPDKIRIITEQVGGVITGELGKDLLVRTFVHEPAEVPWHSQGLAAVEGVPFTGMHKGPVQDWQPYNPHHPCIGDVGDHPSVMELDLAGEYYGLSVLPFCAPGYYRYRLRHLWENKGIGVVARIERGSHHGLGTPNEINMRAVNALLADPEEPLESIWNGFIEDFYGLAPGDAGQAALLSILEDTFPIRLKSHYALGIWALEKGSDFPTKASLGQFHDRGKMPKWDPDWQDLWDRLKEPDRRTILWLWQEGSEAVSLAEQALVDFEGVRQHLDAAREADLARRLLHQSYAAGAWRAMDLFIWSLIARNQGLEDPDLEGWIYWAAGELGEIRDAMLANGLDDVGVAGPGRIGQFLANTEALVVESADPPEPPPPALFSPIRVLGTGPDTAQLSFQATREVKTIVDLGTEIPDYGRELDAGDLAPGTSKTLTVEGLEPGRRYVVRLRGDEDGMEHRGGDFWIFTPYQ